MEVIDGAIKGSIQLIVGLVCFLVFGLLLLALCFALFARAFRMWIIAIFSPLFGLFHFFGKNSVVDKLEKDIGFKTFIGLAMVPVYVAAALSFGLVFLTMTVNVDLSKKVSVSSYIDNFTKDPSSGNVQYDLGRTKTSDGKEEPIMSFVAQ